MFRYQGLFRDIAEGSLITDEEQLFAEHPAGTRLYVALPNDRFIDPSAERLLRMQLSWRTYDSIVRMLKSRKLAVDNLVVSTKGKCIMLPGFVSKKLVIDGREIITPLQRVVLYMVSQSSRYTANQINWLRMQDCIFTYARMLERMVVSKNGLINEAVGCIHPVSGRGVISADPRLPVDCISLPKKMVVRWSYNKQVQQLYSIEPGDADGLVGNYVVAGRHPTHDRGSIVALKLRVHSGTTFRINPFLIASIWQGDFDGDTMHVFLPTTGAGKEGCLAMTLQRFLGDYRFLAAPKEVRHLVSDLPGSPGEIDTLVKLACLRLTDGSSISWRDMTGQGSTAALVLDEANRAKLRQLGAGLSVEQIVPDLVDSMGGYRTTAAVTGYRTIKGAVAVLHGAMSSAIALATALYKGKPEFRQIIVDLSVLKRIMAGQGLSAKHGSNNKAIDERGRRIQQMFYRPHELGWSRQQAYDFLVSECGLPAREVETLLSVVWCDPPRNINDRLREISPFYMITRRGANLNLLSGAELDNSIIAEFFSEEEGDYA